MLDLIIAKSGKTLLQYRFKNTNSSVYTIEEAAYVAYNNFYLYFDEILNNDFYNWLSELNLNNYVKIIKESINYSSKIDSFITFLSLSNIYHSSELNTLKEKMELFYNNSKFEQNKRIAYEYAKINKLNYSIKFYLEALSYEEDINVISNLGYLNLLNRNYSKSKYYLEKAFQNKKDKYIIENLIECYIKMNDLENAKNLLKTSESILDLDTYTFYIGEISYLEKDYETQISFYLEALRINYKKKYILKIIDFYIKNRQYKKANDFINTIDTTDIDLIVKIAETFQVSESSQRACSYLEEQNNKIPFNIKILASLVKYKRKCYDIDGANYYLNIAKQIDNNNNRIRLEEARLNKAKGSQVEYMSGVKEILDDLKKSYRLTN